MVFLPVASLGAKTAKMALPPPEPFTTLEFGNPSTAISELHEIHRTEEFAVPK